MVNMDAKISGKTHSIRIYKSGARPFSPVWCSDHHPLLYASSHNLSSSALNFKIYICGVMQIESTFEKRAAFCHYRSWKSLTVKTLGKIVYSGVLHYNSALNLDRIQSNELGQSL